MSRQARVQKGIMNRRELMKSTVAAAVSGGALLGAGCKSTSPTTLQDESPSLRGNINHSLVSWPYMNFGDKWSLDAACRMALKLGCKSVELVGPEGWNTLSKYGLACAISPNGMPGEPYVKGLNNPAYQAEVIEITRKTIEAAAEAPVSVPSVIAFTGFEYIDVDRPEQGSVCPEEGARNTVAGLKKLAAIAEPLGVDIYLEHLNTRVEDDNARGHPGYQGDDIDYCADIIRQVGSPNVKLLFDIYHVQIMDGDLIRRIRDYGTDLIGHIHTAGNPGRRELDGEQEINYPAVMQALLDIGYQGYVGHEFIPTGDPWRGLVQAVAVCDV